MCSHKSVGRWFESNRRHQIQATSLTTSVVSRTWASLVARFRTHLSRQRRRTGFLQRELRSSFDDLCPTAWLGPFSSSLWWRNPPAISSVTVDHDVLCKLPQLSATAELLSIWSRSMIHRRIPSFRAAAIHPATPCQIEVPEQGNGDLLHLP